MTRRGFTIVELIIVITIIGILLTLAVASLNGSQEKARDDERRADIESIALHLENFYTNGPTIPTAIPAVTNLIVDPSFEITAGDWSASCSAASFTRVTSQHYTGSAAGRLDTTGANQCAYYQGGGPFIDTNAGRTYSMSAWVRGNGSAQLTIGQLPGGAIVASSDTITLSSTWQRLTVTGTTTSGATDVYPVIWQRSAGTQSLYVDAVMVTETSYVTNYADGSSTSWNWNGSTNDSESSGPAVLVGAPGTYPSLAVTSEDLFGAHLPDVDPKTFRAPGIDNLLDTFVPATNNTQTTAGVTPQPTTDQYVYQPIDSEGGLCYDYDCRKFNLYYRLEADDTVYKYESKNR